VRKCFTILIALAVFQPVLSAQQPAPPKQTPPLMTYEVVSNFFKITPDQNFGEVLGVAVNSKGSIVVLNHPGSATTGPLYGGASTQLWEFDSTGKFVREIGKAVYGLGYGHAVRFDKYDNLWHVDKGTNSVTKFNPAGYVTMNLGRRPEAYDSKDLKHVRGLDAKPAVAMFDGPTDIGWDAADNIYVSEGYANNRVTKWDKEGTWIKAWGQYGLGGVHANENPGQFNNAHNLQVDRQGNVYVADRGNRRIQVFDGDGKFLRFMYLNAPYDKTRQPVRTAVNPNAPDETGPWGLCITTNGPTQYLFAIDDEPGRVYKMTLDGKMLGMFGESGRTERRFASGTAIACPSEDVIFVADMNNWTPKKILLKGAK
jgi:sugar lactone lactonase YvrE